MTKSNRIHVLTLISFVVGTSQFVITGILDQVAASVGVPIATAGQLITAYALANAIGTPLFMMATARKDRRSQLLLGLLMIVAGLFGSALFPGFVFLMFFRVLIGIGSGVYNVSANGIVVKLAPEGRQASAMATLAMGYGTSLIVGVPLGRLVAAAFGWTAVFGATGVLGAIGLAVLAWSIPPAEAQAPVPLGRQLSYLKNPRVLVSLFAALAMFIGYSAVNTYIAPILAFLSPMDDRRMSLALMAIGIACVVGSRLGGFFADRLGLAPTLIGGMAIQAAALALILPVSAWNLALPALILVWAAASWTCGPILNFNMMTIAPEASAILLSLNSTFVQLGFAAGAVIGGFGAAAGGSLMPVLWLGAFSVTIAAILIAVSFRFKRGN